MQHFNSSFSILASYFPWRRLRKQKQNTRFILRVYYLFIKLHLNSAHKPLASLPTRLQDKVRMDKVEVFRTKVTIENKRNKHAGTQSETRNHPIKQQSFWDWKVRNCSVVMNTLITVGEACTANQASTAVKLRPLPAD